MEITVKFYDEEGDEIEAALPAHHVVCSHCEGHGTHLREAIRSHAYSREEFEESFDEEEQAEYFRHGGRYDVQCEVCGGKRVMVAVDEEACRSDEQKALLKAYNESERERAQSDAEDRATMRSECGDYGGY